MSQAYRPKILAYFDELEMKYGEHFTFDALKYTELQSLERFAHHAIEADPDVEARDKDNLRALLNLIRKQIEYRDRFTAATEDAISG